MRFMFALAILTFRLADQFPDIKHFSSRLRKFSGGYSVLAMTQENDNDEPWRLLYCTIKNPLKTEEKKKMGYKRKQENRMISNM